MRLDTTAERANALVASIPHKSCTKAIPTHWIIRSDGSVSAQAVLWLFCWAKTGMNSEDARTHALHAFNEILPVRFSDLDLLVDHAWARTMRYATGDIEADFDAKLRTA